MSGNKCGYCHLKSDCKKTGDLKKFCMVPVLKAELEDLHYEAKIAYLERQNSKLRDELNEKIGYQKGYEVGFNKGYQKGRESVEKETD